MALPWLQADPKRRGASKFDCATCLPNTGPFTRSIMHCGYMPRDQWQPGRDGLPPGFAEGVPYTPDVCPGWLVRQPAVCEAAEAHTALEAHVLDRFDPFRLRVVYLAAMAARRGVNLWTQAQMKTPPGGG